MLSDQPQSIHVAQKNTSWYVFISLYYLARLSVFLGQAVLSVLTFPFHVVRFLLRLIVRIVHSIQLQKGIQSISAAILSLPRALTYLLKHIVLGIEWVGLSIIHAIVSFYTFVTSSYFRYFVYGFLFCLMYLFVQQAYFFIKELPSPRSIGEVNFAQSTHLYDRNGKLLYEIYRDVNRTSVPLSAIPQDVIQATIAIEDKNFYHHKGISVFGGIVRAMKDTYLTKELQGGSTITQQLVKSALLTPERTIERKLKEIVLALWTEQLYSKEQIMEMYLNQVPYGGSSYGIEEASKVYFGKAAADLSLSEAALLAGLPKAPSVYSPFVDPDLARRRRDQVLEEMVTQGYITREQFSDALTAELTFLPPTTNIRAPHFVMYARQALENEYGTVQVEENGFDVVTTLDLVIQEKAEQILREEVEKLKPQNVSNGAMIVMDPATGEILAMVGSIDYFKEGFGAFNVTTALRQPGSTLKPILYSMAIQNGYTAATRIDDSPIIFGIPGSKPYQPVNYDRRFHGSVPIRYALGNSYNVPAVKVLNTLGVSNFVEYAKTLGIDSWDDSSRFGLSIALGGGEVSLVDLTQAYSVFANGGYRVEPNPFLEISDDKGRTVTRGSLQKSRVIDEGVSFIISDILSDNKARAQAFGINNPLYLPGKIVSAKTGTTNDYKDAWTMGFTDKVVIGVWVGNNNNSSMARIAGSLGAGPIFNRMMTYMIDEHGAAGKMKQPEAVTSLPCYGGQVEYFLRGTEKASYCRPAVIKPPDGATPVQEVRNVTQ
ncbi:PBP1A family penicillin-binding protein [Candidatus Woesebacteria bacterium]|nr:PBP1A family penicillin-binding protein [Candidatus Woesebacteria bacterium]